MGDSASEPLTQEKLAFFGAISASLSHELKNVLATINEFSGLLEDLSYAAGSGRPLKPERLQGICSKIATQIGRGESLLEGLNRFSHSVDAPVATVDLSSLLRDITTLCLRFANLKQVQLETDLPDPGASVRIDPFACQHAVYLCIDMALRAAAEQRAVKVSLEVEPGVARIVIESADPFTRSIDPARAALVESIVSQCSGATDWTSEAGRDRVALSFSAG